MAGILDELRAEVEREKSSAPKKKSVLEDLKAEVAQEPRKESELERIRREVDVNPESLRARRAEGDKLSDAQQRIAFEAERSRGLWDMTKGVAKKFPEAAWDIAKKITLGTKEYLQETAPALGSALATAKYSQMPTPENLAVADELRKKQEAENARAWAAQRSAASGIATDIEETANAAVRGALFGTSITDLAAETAGLIAKEKSFQNYLSRESMREQERKSVEEYPERASFLLSESPLADVALDIGTAFQGGTAQEQLDRAKVAREAYREGMLEQAASFKPNENISAAFESVSPISIPAKLVKPFTKLTTGAMETAGGLALRGVTKPTIRGVNPLEGVGLGINWVGDKSETLGKALSRAVTGTEDTAIAGLISTPVKTATYLPGKILTGTGRTMRDLGRQIDAGGIRGRTGLLERLGRDPASADFLRDMFGPGSQKSAERLARRNAKRLEAGKAPIEGKTGGIARARAADWTMRMANTLAQSGASGAALNGIIGAADIETAEEFGQATGTGFGIGVTMGANIPGRVGAALDPTTSFAQKVDQILMTDPEDRRRDEDADLNRFRGTIDPTVKEKIDKVADPNNQLAARQRELEELFQRKAEAEYREEDTSDLDQIITVKSDEFNRLQQDIANLDPASLAERKRAVEVIMMDAFDSFKTNGRAAGLNGVDVQILESQDFEPFLRAKWGKNLSDAEAIVAQLDGKTDLSPSEIDTLGRAKATVQQFRTDVQDYSQQLGFGLSDGNYDKDTPAHLRMSNIGAPTLGINAEALLRDSGRVGLRYLMQHEGQHVLENFKEVQEMQRPLRELFFGRVRPVIDPVTGKPSGEQITPGIITDEWLDTAGVEVYGRKFGGINKFKGLFNGSLDQQREYLRKEIMADLSGMSESRYGTVRDALDSTGQALIDRVLIAKKNSLLGRIRSALYSLGVEIDSNGGIQSLLFEEQLGLSPEALALMRQFKRAQRDLTDTLTYTTTGPENQVEIPITELLTNRGLQEAYRDDVIWDKEQILAVFDDAGNQVAEIPIPPGTADSALDEYRMRNGKLVDENGNELTLSPEINIQAIPDGSRVSIDTRIARNPDGSPKILSNKEIKSRARQRNQMIRDAIDNAPDDGSGVRLRDTGNGSYRGTLSPTQLQAIMSLPNDVVPPSLKRNTAVFNELLQQGDGSRVLMEYQPALRAGKYRALAPKIRDVVPIGFQFSKDGNFLATTISVSRMFDKMNAWAQKRPENLNLWGRDLTRFWDDVRAVLDNHNKGLKAEGVDPKDGTMKGTPLDQDPAIALEKKNRINDFFNLFNKDTEGLNPSRTKLPVRRGQDSADRIIMSARMDRINQLQVSNAEKLPVDYGKMTVNFMPSDQTMPEDLTDLDVENDMEIGDETGVTAAQFLPGIRYTSLPDDPKKAMADFYMLNAMITTPPTGWSLGKFGGKEAMYSPSVDPTGRYAGVRAEKYQFALDEAKQTLIPALHDKITKALYFAIGAELRHVFDQVSTGSIPKDIVDSPFYQEYAREYAIQGSGIFGLKKPRAPRRYKSEGSGYKASFVAMENARKKLGMSVADVARFAERIYREPRWSSSYGGSKWGDIAAHLAKMSDPEYSTERVRAVMTDPETGRMQVTETNEFRDPGAYNQMFQEIDRAYDLQHNTNTVFNKLKKYYLGSEGYGWIAKMLDFKANVANPRELRGLVSGTMGKLADAWFSDMRADAPLTQDLEAKVVEQLPESFTQNMDPAQFLEILKDTVGKHYRKSSSDPFAKIASEAKGIFVKNGGTNKEWEAIEKDQNAHIGLLLDDNFGDLGVARTDAVKLFRMLLVEGKDPRVTGKKERTPLNVPKPEPSTSASSVLKANKDMVGFAAGSKVIGDGFGEGEWKVKLVAKNPAFNTLTLYKNNKPVNSYNVAVTTKGKPMMGSVELATDMINKDIALNTPQQASGTAISPGDLLSPEKIKESAKKILANWDSNKVGLGSVDILGHQFYLAPTGMLDDPGSADLTVRKKNASGPAFGPPTIIKTILMGKTSAQQIAEAIQEFQDWLGAAPAEYTQQNLKTEMKPQMPAQSKKVSDLIAVLPAMAALRVNQLIKNLQDPEWVDVNLGNLPPSDIDASAEYVETLLLSGLSAPAKAIITDSIGAGDVEALGKYLYDVGKWAADKLEKRKSADMEQEIEEEGLTPDSPATGYTKPDGTPMTIAEAAKEVGPYDPETGMSHVYFTTNSDTAVTNPYEDETGDPINDEWAPGNKSSIMNYWSHSGVLPSVVESALAIFDAANPGHLYLKPEEGKGAAGKGVAGKGAAETDAIEFLDNMLIDDEPSVINGNTWELEGIENDDGGEIIGAVVKLNGVEVSNMIPVDTETMTLAVEPSAAQTDMTTGEIVYQDYFALDWMKDWKAPETGLETALKAFLTQTPVGETTGKAEKVSVSEFNKAVDNIVLDNGFVSVGGLVVALFQNRTTGVQLHIHKSGGGPDDGVTLTPQEFISAGPSDKLKRWVFDTLKGYVEIDKTDGKAEKVSLLTPDQDQMMVAASELVAALSGGYIAKPEVMIGDKNFVAQLNSQGNIVVTGYDKNNEAKGSIPIHGSKTMDPIDLEAAVYDAIDTIGAYVNKALKPAAKTKNPTPDEINDATDGLLNASDGDSVTIGGYEFQTVLGGQGGASVNILPEGTRDIIDTFYYDASDFDSPSELFDVLHHQISQFFENNPEDKGGGGTGPSAQMMPAGITPKTLYNFYHLATLESQGRIKSEYGQGLMREYLNIYKQKYLETLAPLVSDQIKKYIGRGRVDEGVTDEVLEAAANDPVALDELMRQTYRSDMKRRNDVWNNITEHLRGLAAAGTTRDIIFRIDRLNNAIHNTNELLFSKFKNAGELMDAFEAINDARDERAYGRMVDKDLRDIEEFEGGPGPGARFMPDVANAEDLTSAVASILSARNVRDDRAKKWLLEAYRKNFARIDLPEGIERANLSDYRAKKNDPDWMRKPGLQSFKSLKAAEKDRVGHIADYLNTLDERELSKLPKQTFADIEKKVAEWDKRLQRQMGKKAQFVEEGKDIATLEIFEDGFSIVRLLSKGAYNDEGKCMGHCVGSYNPKNKNQTILSLRGPDGESHATLELFNNFRELIKEKISEQAEIIAEMNDAGDDDGFVEQEVDEDVFIEAEENVLEEYGLSSMEDVAAINKTVRKDIGGFISQIKGKANKAPLKKYADKILRFIQNSSGRYAIVADGENLGLVKRNITDLESPSPFYLMGNEPKTSIELSPAINESGIRTFLSSPRKKAIPADADGKYVLLKSIIEHKIVVKNTGVIVGDTFPKDYLPLTKNSVKKYINWISTTLKEESKNPKNLGTMSRDYVQGLAARFMPGSSEVDQSLAGVTGPSIDRGPLSGTQFMPGYNPRYTKDDGSFDRDAWLNDRRRAEAELRRRGVYKSDLSEEEYENEVRALLREMR
jgi:hypothetical protein